MITRIHRISATAAVALFGLIAATALPARAAIAGLRQGQGRRRLGPRRRPDRALGGEGARLRAALSRIKVSITSRRNVLEQKIDQQIKDGKLEVDAAIFQTLQDFVRWKRKAGSWTSRFEVIDANGKDRDGAFYGTMVIAMPYMVNTEKVSAADVRLGAGFPQTAVGRASS